VITSLHFLEALPGLSAATDFDLTSLDDAGLLYSLRDAQDSTRLVAIQPGPYFSEYEPTFGSEVLSALALEGADDDRRAVLVIVTPSQPDTPATANLLAPLVLNTETGDALQVILEGAPWPLRAPLVAA
jgi:flagellar assembly factor FliW